MATKPKEAGWFAVSSDNWKTHAVPATFVDALIAEMGTRKSEGEIVRKPVTTWGIDRGGMCYADRPKEEFEVGGLRLGMASECVAGFRAQLAALKPRKFVKRTYFKLHCHWNCVVLTPALRRRLLEALGQREASANAKAEAFYAAKRAD